jgi:hypothetical protein
MTWLRSLRFIVPTAAILLISLPACSPPSLSNHPASSQLPGEHCADLLASALTSPDVPVAGAFDCQAPALASNAQGSGIKTDVDIQGFAKVLGFTSAVDLGGANGAFTYLVSGSNGSEVLVIWTDSNGLVFAFEQAHP